MTLSAIRWALVGYGSGGRIFHAPLIASAVNLELVAVVTGNPGRRQAVAEDFPGIRTVSELPELVELGVEGVTITTPPATHAELAHRALDLGLAVVIDKPFALTAVAAQEVVDHAVRLGAVLTAYQNRRWDSDLLTIRRLIDSGVLGEVHRFTSRIDRFRPVKPGWSGGSPAQGGGTLLDLGPHLVDQALHLFGPVSSVHAELRTLRPGAGADDDIELHLRHRSGVLSTLAAGMASAAVGRRFVVNGSQGGFAIDGFDVQEEQLKAGGSPRSLGEAWGVEPESAFGTLTTSAGATRIPSERGSWDTFYPQVGASVQRGLSVPVEPIDAVATAAVLDAARTSAATNSVVHLERPV